MEPTHKAPLRVAPVPTPPRTPAPASDFVDFAQAGRSHAKAARLFLADAEEGLLEVAEGTDDLKGVIHDRAELLVLAAQAHALTSLAFTQLAPPARRRPGR